MWLVRIEADISAQMRREKGRRLWWRLATPWPSVRAVALAVRLFADGGQSARGLIPREPTTKQVVPGVHIDRHDFLHIPMCLHCRRRFRQSSAGPSNDPFLARDRQ